MFDRNIRHNIEIYRAEVLEVFPERGTCDLRTRDVESKLFRDVPWSSPFADVDGMGIDFCPVEGQMCYMLASTSNSQELRGISSVILGWSFPEIDGAHGAGRELLSRNDLKLANRRGAKILLDANRGDLLMQSGAACGVTMYRMSNFMHLISDSYMIETRGGHVLWETSGEEEDEDRVRYSCGVKSKAGDEVGFLRILASSDRSGNFFEVRLTGTDGQSGEYTPTDTFDIYKRPTQYAKVRFSSDGKGMIHTASTLDLSANEEVRIRSKGDIRAEANYISGEARGPVTSDSSSYAFSPVSTRFATDTLEIETKSLTVFNRADGEILLRTADNETHQDSENRRLLTEDLQHWLFNHTHPTPSGNSLPPQGRPVDVPININNRVIDEQELASEIYASKVGADYEKRVLAGALISVSSIITAVNGLVPGTEQAILALLANLELVPQGTQSASQWFVEGADALKVEADNIQAEIEEMLDAQGNPTLVDQQYGVSSVNDVITQDTKVR